MSQSARCDAGRLLLKVVTAMVLVFAIIENGFFFLALTWNLAAMISVCIPILLVLTDLLFLWLRFRFRDANRALLGAAVAAAAAPWTGLFLLVESTEHFRPWPKGPEAAYLFGSLIPFALLAAVGLGKRR
jgi:hypothetical protein